MLTIKVVGLLWTLAHIAQGFLYEVVRKPTTGVIRRLIGWNITTMDYDSSGFNGGPINQGSDLNCNFSSQCCWKEQSSDSWNTWQTESAGLLISADSVFATLVSCSITCTIGPITVSLRHFTTANVVIKVCTKLDGTSRNRLQNCQTLPKSAGPDIVTLPAVTELSNLVIAFSEFSENVGSISLIDDIQVNAQVCTTTIASTTTTTTTTTSVCEKVQCNFESITTCSYTDAWSTRSIPVTRKWQIVEYLFQHLFFGRCKKGENQYCMVADLYPNDTAALETDVQFDQDRVVRFLAIRSTEGTDLQACCDNVQSCIYNMGKNVQVADIGNWRTVSILCPAGTKKVIMYAKNSGINQGAVGLDNIQVFIPSSGSPESATTPAC